MISERDMCPNIGRQFLTLTVTLEWGPRNANALYIKTIHIPEVRVLRLVMRLLNTETFGAMATAF